MLVFGIIILVISILFALINAVHLICDTSKDSPAVLFISFLVCGAIATYVALSFRHL